MIRIVLGGDVVPSGRTEAALRESDAGAVFGDLLGPIRAADLAAFNLECPLTSGTPGIAKSGPVLGADPRCAAGLAAAGWKVANLANNHSFDHGSAGLKETIRAVEGAGMAVVGAGLDQVAAGRPWVGVLGGQRVVLYAMAEREFSAAGSAMGGANPLDLIHCVQTIRRDKQGGTFVVLVHGGKEHFAYPPPEMVRRCRFLVEMGADAVICCHAHCPLPWEFHQGRPICYGLGNLVFEALRTPREGWNDGYLAVLEVSASGEVGLAVEPYRQRGPGEAVRLLDAGERRQFTDQMEKQAAPLRDPAMLERIWRDRCRQERPEYLDALFGHHRWPRPLRSLFRRLLGGNATLLPALLVAQCETHREVLMTMLEMEREVHDRECSQATGAN